MGRFSKPRLPFPNKTLRLSLLPRDILFEILVRLGAKSRGKLCCVSKTFRSIITAPSFVEFHRNWSTAASHGTTILFSVRAQSVDSLPLPGSFQLEEFYTINYKSLGQNQPGMGKLLEAKRVSWSRDLQYWCSAPDLICLYNRDGAVEIPNLCTGQHTTLPATPTWSDFETEACAHVGLDGSSAYKVLKSESCFGLDKVKHWVLTLGVDATWREIKAPDCHFRTSVCINGVTYFEDVIFRNRSRWKELYGGFPIVAFDIWSETFHGVARPLGETEFDLVKSSFLELDGQLAIICLRHKRLITWSLDSASCWKKNVFPAPLDSASLFYCTIKTTPTGEILLVMPNERGTCSLWVLFDKFTCPVWKKIGIEGLGEFPNYNCEMIKAIKPIMVQNVAENLFHLE